MPTDSPLAEGAVTPPTTEETFLHRATALKWASPCGRVPQRLPKDDPANNPEKGPQ
ncbi:hypothetical protein DAPPUDRAFT_244709 [Daphnia pulex]|uniref:Uncharacterized protein n=1 Tax=Daphnia pulex TaxID=6669 RepID=E9GLL6_DAPPU|nr:hypothetical protein DAPPUDRAFT_244709 [Daphnia pulex]|eukprot:EFX79669.1 hypothetical protein DAPPUDRAFT_244709 [Daphnia pulex]